MVRLALLLASPLTALGALALACGTGSDGTPTSQPEPQRIVLVSEMPYPSREVLEETREVIEERADKLGASGTRVTVDGQSVVIDVGTAATPFPATDLYRPFLLQFCQPVRDREGNVATAPEGSIDYLPGSCSPTRSDDGGFASPIEYARWSDSLDLREVIWEPATVHLDGTDVQLSSYLLSWFHRAGQDDGAATFTFALNEVGGIVLETVRQRLGQLPLVMFLDGELLRDNDGPIIAVDDAEISRQLEARLGGTTADDLERALELGTLPMPMRIAESPEANPTPQRTPTTAANRASLSGTAYRLVDQIVEEGVVVHEIEEPVASGRLAIPELGIEMTLAYDGSFELTDLPVSDDANRPTKVTAIFTAPGLGSFTYTHLPLYPGRAGWILTPQMIETPRINDMSIRGRGTGTGGDVSTPTVAISRSNP
jgi:hypothetical protein